jgi:thimet oligopeptidase
MQYAGMNASSRGVQPRTSLFMIGLRTGVCLAAVIVVAGCRGPAPFTTTRPVRSMAELQAAAKRFHAVMSEPRFEATPAEVAKATTNAVKRFNASLEAIANRKPEEATFTNTVQALDQARWELFAVHLQLGLLSEVSTNKTVRAAAAQAERDFSKTVVDAQYRQDIYAAIKSVAKSGGEGVKGEDGRLLRTYLQSRKRVGLDLPPDQQERLQATWEQLGEAQLEFLRNLAGSTPRLKFKRAELKGATRYFLQRQCTRVNQDEYLVPANIYLGDFRLEQTRKRLWLANQNAAAELNRALVQRILEIRQSIARQLGHDSWADYETQKTLAGSPSVARAFCEELSSRERPKFDAQISELAKIKAEETGNPTARIEPWDTAYYGLKRKGSKHRRDALARYFPAGHVLDGLFDVWERVMGLKIEPVRPSSAWADTVRLFAVTDARSGEPLGLVYFDLYARAGKRNDSFTTTVIPGGQTAEGLRRCPVAAVEMPITDYPKNTRFSLWPESVGTLYHEFGHALHEVLCRSKYFALEGNSVSRDYVEVPSELLEMWASSRDALDVLTRHNPKPVRKMSPKHFDWLKAELADGRLSTYEWSTAWALADLALNTEVKDGVDAIALSNQVLSAHYLPVPSGSAPVTGNRGFVEYGAAVYSHVWCEAIAADLLTEFEKAPGGLLDQETGMRLRREIFETGDMRPPRVSIEEFLRRPYSTDAFFKRRGLDAPASSN